MMNMKEAIKQNVELLSTNLNKQLDEIKSSFQEDLAKTDLKEELKSLQSKYLGTEGKLTAVFKDFRILTPELRIQIGSKINILKNEIDKGLDSCAEKIKGKDVV